MTTARAIVTFLMLQPRYRSDWPRLQRLCPCKPTKSAVKAMIDAGWLWATSQGTFPHLIILRRTPWKLERHAAAAYIKACTDELARLRSVRRASFTTSTVTPAST